MFVTHYDSPLGRILLASDMECLTGLWLDTQTQPEDGIVNRELPIFVQAKAWLDRYFRGEAPEIGELPLAPSGTDFQRQVWDILCRIPYGQTVTYGQIAGEMAARMGKEKMSAQAVGGAVGRNPISIIIPCHRCVGAAGKLTGYAGGLDKKIWLLRHEGWLKEENNDGK